jgi:hypothetical protein
LLTAGVIQNSVRGFIKISPRRKPLLLTREGGRCTHAAVSSKIGAGDLPRASPAGQAVLSHTPRVLRARCQPRVRLLLRLAGCAPSVRLPSSVGGAIRDEMPDDWYGGSQSAVWCAPTSNSARIAGSSQFRFSGSRDVAFMRTSFVHEDVLCAGTFDSIAVYGKRRLRQPRLS